jgi:hypothetical protein
MQGSTSSSISTATASDAKSDPAVLGTADAATTPAASTIIGWTMDGEPIYELNEPSTTASPSTAVAAATALPEKTVPVVQERNGDYAEKAYHLDNYCDNPKLFPDSAFKPRKIKLQRDEMQALIDAHNAYYTENAVHEEEVYDRHSNQFSLGCVPRDKLTKLKEKYPLLVAIEKNCKLLWMKLRRTLPKAIKKMKKLLLLNL